MSTPTAASALPAGRLSGVDLARAVAIVGMVMVHFRLARAGGDVGTAETLYSLSRGRASILFALLAAVGIALAARALGDRGRLGLSLLGRSLVLVPLGLALQLVHDQVHVILQFYAVYLAIGWLALRAASTVLLAGAAGWALVGPLVHTLVRDSRPEWFEETARLGDPLGLVTRDLLLTGAYPAVTWGAPLLFGVWLGHRDLRSTTVRTRMVAGGAAVTTAVWALSRTLEGVSGARTRDSVWWQLVLDDPHSQMPLWLLGATASAVAVLGACLHLADAAPRVTGPLAAFGRLALTAYVLHLLLVALVPRAVIHADVRVAAVAVLAFTVVMTLVATLWLRAFDHGPLEAVARAPYLALRRYADRRAGPVPAPPQTAPDEKTRKST